MTAVGALLKILAGVALAKRPPDGGKFVLKFCALSTGRVWGKKVTLLSVQCGTVELSIFDGSSSCGKLLDLDFRW